MKSSKILKEERNAILVKMEALVKKAKDENRQLDTAESTQYRTWKNEAEKIVGDIEIQEDIEQRQAETAAAEFTIAQTRNKGGEQGEKNKIKAQYSLQRAIRSQLKNGKLDGLEKEMHETAIEEMRSINKTIQGVGVPQFLVKVPRSKQEQRATAVVSSATNAGNFVATMQGDVIPVLEPRLLAEQLGAQVITGLTGILEIPKDNGKYAATWEGEITENDETNSNIGKLTATPKRLGAKSLYSRTQLFQSTPDMENFVRNKLNMAIARKLDSTCINGAGGGTIPTGILNFANSLSVAIGTNGGAITRAHLLELEELIATADADMGTLNFLSTPKVRKAMKSIKLDDGSGQFLFGQDGNNLETYNAAFTNQVPSDLTKGTGTDLNALIFGDFSSLKIYQWQGIDMIVDEVTLADFATIKVTANSYWDILADYENKFAVIKDILIA